MSEESAVAAASLATGINHVGYVVNDLEAAVDFFISALGAHEIRRGAIRDDQGHTMSTVFGVDDGDASSYVFLDIGGDQVELLQWAGPPRGVSPSNSELGGRHLALNVADLDAAVAALSAIEGLAIRQRSDRGFVYVGTPFGLELQLMPS